MFYKDSKKCSYEALIEFLSGFYNMVQGLGCRIQPKVLRPMVCSLRVQELLYKRVGLTMPGQGLQISELLITRVLQDV